MSRTALGLWLTTVTLVIASTVVSVGRDTVSDIVLYGVYPVVLATVGALVLSSRHENVIGWAFAVLAIYIAFGELCEGYGLLAEDRGLAGSELGAWVTTWNWVGEVATWAVIITIFPRGLIRERRWRWIPWCAGAGAILGATSMAFGSRAAFTFDSGVNPFYLGPTMDLLYVPAMALLMSSLIGAAASLVVRLRRSRGVERQQLKWLALAAAVLALITPVAVFLWTRTPVAGLVVALAINALPLAIGVAILRHRLYDIDVVIKRTLVYSLLTAVLIATYLVLVLVLQVVLRPLSGESDVAVAASTLVVAALFRPVRGRIQTEVDRRFYRSRYDATRILEGFGAQLRHEVDLETVSLNLSDVVRETMQPTQVSVWLHRPAVP